MMLEGASCYEQFAVSLMKACQANPLLEGDTSKSIGSLCQQTKQLATTLREEIATPLQQYHTNNGETIPAIHQKYVNARQRASGARQRAILAHTKYLKAVQDAEQACNSVLNAVAENEQQANGSKPNADATVAEEKKINSPEPVVWEKTLETYGKLKGPEAVDRVTHLLNDVKVLQRRYESLVRKENNAVKIAHSMEAVALEGIQKMEEQRLCAFYDAMVRTYEAIKVSLDNLIISAEADFDESSKEQVAVRKKGDFFSMLKVGAAQDATTGVADAETLGLDEDIGRLRDEMQTQNASRLARLKKAKALAGLFATAAAAAEKLGNGLQQIMKHEDSYVSR